jgi:hypothetical protein
VIETATRVLGDEIVEEQRRNAYEQAYRIAKEDDAALRELPSAA